MLRLDRFRVTQGQPISLARRDTGPGDADLGELRAQFETDVARLRELHERLAAEEQDALLIVLLAFDTGGKDETIQGVFDELPVESLRVEKFSEPSAEELAHDFLWAKHAAAPRRGEIVVFNRSYYDDISEPRLQGELSAERSRQRFPHILNFENLLREENNTRVLKFYMHISRDEQSKRIWERLDDPDRQWDFDSHDIETQERWDELQGIYEEIINATSTDAAPWHVVPADHDEFRNAVVARIVTRALEEIDPQYPDPPDDINEWKERLRELDRAAGREPRG